MSNTIKIFQSSILIGFVLSAYSCSDKSGFSEKSRGDDPFYVSPSEEDTDQDTSDSSPWKSERFEQVERTNLDVLWVIDNSASMAPYQEKLAENIDSFLAAASQWDANIQMAVTSTDMCEAIRPSEPKQIMCPDKASTSAGLRGKIAGGKVIRSLDETARNEFAKLARLGVSGSSFEHGLSAAKAAVESSLLGQNGGIIRPDSFLSIVIVSDEEDNGVGLAKQDEAGRNWWAEGKTRYRFTAEDLISYLRIVRPEGRFSVSSVVGTSSAVEVDGPCGSGAALEVGAEQTRSSQLTGGFMLDICSSDWAGGLQAMADNLSSQMNSFKLSSRPTNVNDIVLLVDGIIQRQGWRYIDSRQSIIFDVDFVPAFGAQIEVRYK